MNNIIVLGSISDAVSNLANMPIGTTVYIGSTNIDHILANHASDYFTYWQLIEDIIKNPDYVGPNPNDNSIRFVKQFNDFVHVGVRITGSGKYFVRTMYTITSNKLQDYINKGNLTRV